jgi:methionyl-tRNA formyltransferase
VIERNEVVARPQDERGATFWEGRTPEDGRLMPAMSVVEVDRLVRAATRPYPGAFLDTGEGRLRIWAGEPAAGASAGGGLRLPFADGDFIALDYEREERPGGGDVGVITPGAQPRPA